MTQISSNTVNMDALSVPSPTYLQTLSQIKNGEEVSLARFIDPTKFAAIQAGTSTYNAFTDINSAFTSGARSLYAPRGIYRFSGDLDPLAVGAILRGDGGGEYIGLTGESAGNTVFERQDAGTATSAVLTLGDAASALMLQVRPANFAVATYDMANYPAASGNVPIGIAFGTSSQARHVSATGFPTAGFQLGTVSVVERCYAFQNDKGFTLDPNGATDGTLLNCIAASNYSAGADLENNYWSVLGGRFEWNARYGVITGAESMITGALFDRNGFAGVWVTSGWGKVIVGNYFSRNGVGGDGTSGRWGFSVPGHESYLAVPAGQSCHIQIDFEHAGVITGNRFRHGGDDSNEGCDGPQFVYGTVSGDGATPTNGVTIADNIGDKAEHSELGYNPDYAGVTGSGKPAGGTDTGMVDTLNSGLDQPLVGVKTGLYSGNTEPQNVSVFTVNVPRSTSGKITVRACAGSATNMFDVYFATNAGDAGYTTGVANLLGTSKYSSSTMAANTSDTRYNTVTVHLNATCWMDYVVYTT